MRTHRLHAIAETTTPTASQSPSVSPITSLPSTFEIVMGPSTPSMNFFSASFQPDRTYWWHTLPMLKTSQRTILPAVLTAAVIALAPLPTGNAAVAEMLSRLPSGEISCDQAAAHWTSDADYQAKVAQAQTLAAFDPRGGQILAALGRVDAAAESCGLKGTVGAPINESEGTPDAGVPAGTPASEPDAPGSQQTPTAEAATGSPADTTPVSGAGGTPDAPVTDAEAILGPIRNNAAVPTKTIEILGHGQVEVADAEAMMSNFLRQFTIII